MKSAEEIRKCFRLSNMTEGTDGGYAVITTHNYTGSVVWSFGGGWDHVSVCPFKQKYIPTWEDMCQLKDIFFGEDEWVCEFHPAKSEYVNNMPNCLHLWRPQNEALPIPPSWMTGVKDGQTVREAYAEAEMELRG